MKKLAKILLVNLLFVVGLVTVNAEAFRIKESADHEELNGTEYATLKAAVDAAPTDNSLTIIEMTQDVTLAPGVQVVAGKNLVIDFGGHTYETWEPMIGSKGTETQSFQLLKGSNVYMKNGTLIASTHENSKMFIQNYADLTLDNITIDATTNTYSYFYALSSNNGEVRLRGNTNISVNLNTHARAFDMCWAPNVGYPDGTQITIETTGTISGVIELDLWGTWADDPRSTLNIVSGTYNVKWEVDPRLGGQMHISGGVFNKPDTIDLDEYAVEGKSTYTADGVKYEILPSGTVTIDEEEIYLLKGKTYTLTPKFVTEGYGKYVHYHIEDDDIASFANGVITGLKAGKTLLDYNLGRLGGGVEITVVEVAAAESKDEDEAATNEDANDVTSELIVQVLSDEEVEGLDEETVANVKAAVVAGKTIETEVAVDTVDKADLAEETVNKLEAEAKKSEGTIAGYLDIDVLLKADAEELGKVTKLSEPITITVDVDEELGTVPANMKRTYFVVRLHNGETTLIEATYKDGKLSFETDRFSQYAYGYTDTNKNIPTTGDNIALYLVLFGMSIIGVVGTLVLSKKRIINVSK